MFSVVVSLDFEKSTITNTTCFGNESASAAIHLRGWKQNQFVKCVQFGILYDVHSPDTL
jgi:hypothetical protein